MLTLANIATPQDLFRMATEFQPTISLQVTTDDPEALIERLAHVTSLMSNTGKMLADAKYHRDIALKNSILSQLKDAKRSILPASVMNELNKATCHDLNYLVNWIEQQDKDLKYQSEALRTMISMRKTEMQTFNS